MDDTPKVIAVDFNREDTSISEYEKKLAESVVKCLEMVLKEAKEGNLHHIIMAYETTEGDTLFSFGGDSSERFRMHYILDKKLPESYESLYISQNIMKSSI